MPPRRQTYSQAEINRLVAQGVADALARQQPSSGSEDTANNTPATKPCSYKDFLNCKPLNFKGTEGAIGLLQWIEKMESVFRICNCPDDCKVKYSACTLMEGALTWWNTHAQTVGIDVAYKLPWDELKRMMTEEYCPREEIQQLETEFWNHSIIGDDIAGYTTRFHQLAFLCPTMVNPEYKRVERYIWGLPASIKGMVTASKPGTIQSAVRMAHSLMAQVVHDGKGNKRKADGNPDSQGQTNKKPATAKASASESESKKGYSGTKPFCSKCKRHHDGPCGTPCEKCKHFGHLAKDCRVKACFECGTVGHYRNDCPKLKDNNTAKGRFFVLNARNNQPDPDTGTYLVAYQKSFLYCVLLNFNVLRKRLSYFLHGT